LFRLPVKQPWRQFLGDKLFYPLFLLWRLRRRPTTIHLNLPKCLFNPRTGFDQQRRGQKR